MRRTICTKIQTHRPKQKVHTHTQAADMHRKVSVTVNIILSAKWMSQSPLISFSSSLALFLLFHIQVDIIIIIIFIISHTSASPDTHTHAYPETERWSFWVKEGEMTSKRGEHRKHISYRSLPFTSHYSYTLPSAPSLFFTSNSLPCCTLPD